MKDSKVSRKQIGELIAQTEAGRIVSGQFQMFLQDPTVVLCGHPWFRWSDRVEYSINKQWAERIISKLLICRKVDARTVEFGCRRIQTEREDYRGGSSISIKERFHLLAGSYCENDIRSAIEMFEEFGLRSSGIWGLGALGLHRSVPFHDQMFYYVALGAYYGSGKERAYYCLDVANCRIVAMTETELKEQSSHRVFFLGIAK